MSHDLNDLRLFVLVAQAGGFASASRRNGISRATLSRRVAALEADLGVRLIERSSRAFRLTEPGRLLFERASEAIGLADGAFDCLSDRADVLRGRLRIAAPPSLLGIGFDRLLIDFCAAHPALELQVEATNRRVDLREEGFDCALRVGDWTRAEGDLAAVPFCTVEHGMVIAPALVPALRPTLAETLENVPALAWGGSERQAAWRLTDAAGNSVLQPLHPRLEVQDLAMLRAAAIAGLGLAMMPSFFVRAALSEGTLVSAAFDLAPPTLRIHAVHLGARGMRPALRGLIDFLRSASRDFR